jgi:hypothetical protein
VHLEVVGFKLRVKPPSGTNTSAVTTPTGVLGKAPRPSFARYKKYTHIAGAFTPGYGWYDNYHLPVKPGITSTSTALTIASGASTGITATNVEARYTFAHEVGGVLIHQSNPSDASNVVASLTNDSLDYSAIPATANDARVTHVYLYRSDSGGQYKYDGKVTLGTTTASSTTPSLSLGVALPTTTSGNLDAFARGVPRYTKFNCIYHHRLWLAGDPEYPARFWYSRLGEPESFDVRIVGGDWFDTPGGEAITGIAECADQLVIFTATCFYVLQGFSDGIDGTGPPDFTIVKVSPAIGCISHHAIVKTAGPGGGDLLIFPAQDGIYAYNGSIAMYLTKNMRTYWRDAYLADKANYEDSIAAFDYFWNTYKLLIPAVSSTFYWVGHTLPLLEGGGQPEWAFDVRGRRDETIGSLTNSSKRFELYTGNCDGFLRKENAQGTGSDDGIAKEVAVRFKHYFFGGSGGGVNHGLTFTDSDVYAKNENTEINVDYFAGDEGCGDAVTPQKTIPFAASAVATFNPKTGHFTRLDHVSGRGITVKVRSTSPVGLEIAGFGISWKAGPNTRLSIT